MTETLLFIDDDPNILSGFKRQLRNIFTIETEDNPIKAIERIKKDPPYAVVVCDMHMPGMDGVSVLKEFKQHSPETVRVMLTGNADQTTAIRALNEGNAFRFLSKPCTPEELASVMSLCLEQYKLVTAERELLERTLGGAVKALVDILATIDPKAFGQSTLVRDWARVILNQVPQDKAWEIDLAALLSPIGWVTVPPAVAQKAHAFLDLNPAERDIVEKVPEAGYEFLKNIPRLKNVARNILYQNKGFNGQGLPKDGVLGQDLPFGARLLKILNDLRPYAVGAWPAVGSFSTLRRREEFYDPRLLTLIEKKFRDEEALHPQDTSKPFGVTILALQEGMVLAQDLRQEDGALILSQGSPLTEASLAKLRQINTANRIRQPIFVYKNS